MVNNCYLLLAIKVLSLSPFVCPFVAWTIKSRRRHLFSGWLSARAQLKRSASRGLIFTSALGGRGPSTWPIRCLWSHRRPITEDVCCSGLIKVPPLVLDNMQRKKKKLWFLKSNKGGGQKNDPCARTRLFCLSGYTLVTLKRPAEKKKTAEKRRVDVPMPSLSLCVCVCVSWEQHQVEAEEQKQTVTQSSRATRSKTNKYSWCARAAMLNSNFIYL